MEETLAAPETINRTPRRRIEGILLPHPLGSARVTADSREPGACSLKRIEGGASRFAPCHCLVEHRVKHRHEIAGRGVDALQYLGSRGLLFQCLARLDQEPRVFHR